MLSVKRIFLACIEQQGMNLSTVKVNPMFDITFINNDGKEDETQLTIEGKHDMAVCRVVLDKLFSDFCEENGFDRMKATNVVFVGSDPYYEAENDTEKSDDAALIKLLAYELYKQHWVDTHTTAEERQLTMREYAKDCIFEKENYSFTEWIEERGYNGMLYACYEEFITGEYLDAEYMHELLKDEELVTLYDCDHKQK